METVTYKLFGWIPLWSVTRRADEEALYERLSTRILAEIQASIKKAYGR